MSAKVDEPQSEGEHEHGPDEDKQRTRAGDTEKQRHLAGVVPSPRYAVRDAGDQDPSDEHESANQVEEERGVCHFPQAEPAEAP